MKRVHVLVEGQSEEAFVGRALAPHLAGFGVHVTPTLVVTRRVSTGANFKGGVSSWGQVQRDVKLLLGDTGVVAVTTLLDYYGLPSDAPGMADRPTGNPRDKAEHVEAAIDEAVGDGRLRSHLLIHEFEALLYVDPEACGDYLGNPRITSATEKAIESCGEPEFVNDDPATTPSKRILAAHAAYRKTLDGPALAELIGVDAIRASCPHFDEWLSWLESLGE